MIETQTRPKGAREGMVSHLSKLLMSALLVLTVTAAPALCEILFRRHAHTEGCHVEAYKGAPRPDEAKPESGRPHNHHHQEAKPESGRPRNHHHAKSESGRPHNHHHQEAKPEGRHSHGQQGDDTCCSRLLPAFYFQTYTRANEGSARVLSYLAPLHLASLHLDFSSPVVMDGAPSHRDIALCRVLCRGPSLSVPLYDLLDTYRI